MLVTHAFDDLIRHVAHSFCRQAYPNIRTVDYWTDGDLSERYPQSRYVSVSLKARISGIISCSSTTVNHNKAAGFERRLELYLIENFKHAFDMERFGIIQFWSASSVLTYLTVMFTIPKSCRRRPWRLHIACGEGTGRALERSIRLVRLCGR